jgi:hypothetical protein
MIVLSAERLSISPGENAALSEIRELLAKGTFHHDKEVEAEKPDGFNMNVPDHEGECGTTCCIGGWMFRAMQRDRTTHALSSAAYVNHERSRALIPLFFPFDYPSYGLMADKYGLDYDFPLEEITPAMALTAVDNFRATGNPNWPEVCNLEPSHA